MVISFIYLLIYLWFHYNIKVNYIMDIIFAAYKSNIHSSSHNIYRMTEYSIRHNIICMYL